MVTGARCAVDVGGTFIDFVAIDQETGAVTVEKVRSAGVLQKQFFKGVERLGLSANDLKFIAHGSTMVLNTIVQERGARVGLITTKGFRDVLALGRGGRKEIYNLFYKPPPPLVPRSLRFEVSERVNARGEIIDALDAASAERAILALKDKGVESIAICLLHAYVNPVHEEELREIAQRVFPEALVSISSDIVREWREFERTSTTVLNAYSRPKLDEYLSGLQSLLKRRDFDGPLAIMQSNGGVTSCDAARRSPIRTIQSGPAGGVIGAQRLGALIDIDNLVVADVGGTTFDVALIRQGRYLNSSAAELGGRPVLQPTLEIESIGAGGGSIAWLDKEGGLRVGPQSAQADPGPVCFGMGGVEPTVTDAQLVLGQLNAEAYLGKRMRLDLQAARKVIEQRIAEPLALTVEEAAAGIIRIAAANMAQAVRQITIEHGYDPREFSLLCIGGGGGLFAAILLRELKAASAIIPQNPAVFSAWGLLNADYREDVESSFMRPMQEVDGSELCSAFDHLQRRAEDWFTDNGLSDESLEIERFAEMRYLGQEHTIKVPVLKDDFSDLPLQALRRRFDQYYETAYTHSFPDYDLEFVVLRLAATSANAKPNYPEIASAGQGEQPASSGMRHIYDPGVGESEYPLYARETLRGGHAAIGPAVIEEWNSTILLLRKQNLRVDQFGNLIMSECNESD